MGGINVVAAGAASAADVQATVNTNVWPSLCSGISPEEENFIHKFSSCEMSRIHVIVSPSKKNYQNTFP